MSAVHEVAAMIAADPHRCAAIVEGTRCDLPIYHLCEHRPEAGAL